MQITIPKNDIKSGTTVLILSYPKRPITVCIKKTDCNNEYYNGYRVMVTDGWFADWPIKYENGKIAYDTPEKIPKYAKKLVYAAFKILESSSVWQFVVSK